MNREDLREARRRHVFLPAGSGRFEDFEEQVSRRTDPDDWPFAESVEQSVPVYDGDAVRESAADPGRRAALMAEWVEALDSGPGIIVIARAFADVDPIDRANDIFDAIIDEQRRTGAGAGAGDHFARPGANDRIWNSLEKHCLAEPQAFAAYYANASIALPCEAWLGPGYQVTAQVNRVNPGGEAQTGHRDYHLGFMAPEQMTGFPAHVHRLSPMLTLQGAVAHCDMPVESGPTLYLPYSQTFREGYLAFARPEFQAFFDAHHVQRPLAKGDAVFFNPALMHAAGANRTSDRYRIANLLQISSPFGRAMESVDRARMVLALYPVLLEARRSGALSPEAVDRVIAASAEGYPFPTDLDRDPPVEGLAPTTQAARMREAMERGASREAFEAEIDAQAAGRPGRESARA